jgi:ATP adenylyltransferase (5'',5''''''-P-1,P-4-tetraphosphate phosphorylase II)
MQLYQQIKSLFAAQTSSWELVRNNFFQLENVKIREFDFGDFSVKVQFNKARIISTSARIDEKSIAERACFLCKKNRPTEQESVIWGDYEILVNPYPIFDEHFTVVSKNHIPQQIRPVFTDMFHLASDVSDYYAVFYNGAKCGASVPDHLHFQVVPQNCLPVISDYKRLKFTHADILQDTENSRIYELKNYLRRLFCIEIPTQSKMDFQQIFANSLEEINFTNETMMNIICHCKNDIFYVFVFLRKVFRPNQYFAENEKENLLISPATVELSGVIITPREEDFCKITKEDIVSIYEQTS